MFTRSTGFWPVPSFSREKTSRHSDVSLLPRSLGFQLGQTYSDQGCQCQFFQFIWRHGEFGTTNWGDCFLGISWIFCCGIWATIWGYDWLDTTWYNRQRWCLRVSPEIGVSPQKRQAWGWKSMTNEWIFSGYCTFFQAKPHFYGATGESWMHGWGSTVPPCSTSQNRMTQWYPQSSAVGAMGHWGLLHMGFEKRTFFHPLVHENVPHSTAIKWNYHILSPRSKTDPNIIELLNYVP